MPVVIADTGPINYLILIDHIDVLPVLFNRIILPAAVRDELSSPDAPHSVQAWIARLPAWLAVMPVTRPVPASLAELDAGEKAAITLALELNAELLLIDDRRGVRAARSQGFKVAGTLAVLAMAARRNLLDLSTAFDKLKQTTFHYSQHILDQFLDENSPGL